MRIMALATRGLGVTIAATSIAASAKSATAQTAKPTIVLVHGAFADGSSWAKVIRILQAKGYNVTAVQNPLTSFADDVAATKRALDLQTGPVVLVGHSWAGTVITEAGIDPKVISLVYVSAFAPDVGEVVGDIGKSYPTPAALAAPIVDKSGFMTLSTDAFVKHFASDLAGVRSASARRRAGADPGGRLRYEGVERRVEDEAVVVHRREDGRGDRARRRTLLRQAHERDDDGTEYEPPVDVGEAGGRRRHHHEGGNRHAIGAKIPVAWECRAPRHAA